MPQKKVVTPKRVIVPLTDEDIEALEDVLQDLKGRARDAFDKKHLNVYAIYQKLCKVVSPEVQRAYARREREAAAQMNKDKVALKEELANNPTAAGTATSGDSSGN